jgi:hypothetical protein
VHCSSASSVIPRVVLSHHSSRSLKVAEGAVPFLQLSGGGIALGGLRSCSRLQLGLALGAVLILCVYACVCMFGGGGGGGGGLLGRAQENQRVGLPQLVCCHTMEHRLATCLAIAPPNRACGTCAAAHSTHAASRLHPTTPTQPSAYTHLGLARGCHAPASQRVPVKALQTRKPAANSHPSEGLRMSLTHDGAHQSAGSRTTGHHSTYHPFNQ